MQLVMGQQARKYSPGRVWSPVRAMPLLPLLLLVCPALSEAQGPVYTNIGRGVYTFAGDGL